LLAVVALLTEVVLLFQPVASWASQSEVALEQLLFLGSSSAPTILGPAMIPLPQEQLEDSNAEQASFSV
jgi:hypothetical protein